MTDKFDIFNFLEEYQKHPCLWDKSIVDYKNRGKRVSAEEILLQFSGLTGIKELRQKIRSLRCTYNQELAKIKRSMKTDSGTTSIYKPKLAWFEFADGFLHKNYEDNKETEINLAMNITENTTASQENFNSSQALSSLTQCGKCKTDFTINSTEKSNVTLKTPKRTTKTTNKSNKQQKVNSSLNDAVKALKCARSQNSTPNEFNIFGQYVAAQLEKLPLDKSLKLQMKIQSMLTQARLHTMNNIHCTCENSSTNSLLSYSNMSENFEDGYDDYVIQSPEDILYSEDSQQYLPPLNKREKPHQ